MATDNVTIQVPQPLYHRLERLAELTQRPLESLVVRALSSSIPLLPDDLPHESAEALRANEQLSDDEIEQLAQARFPEERYEQFAALRESRRAGTITETEQATLDQLAHEADLLALRKAYAAVLLKWRGRRLPTLAELEAHL